MPSPAASSSRNKPLSLLFAVAVAVSLASCATPKVGPTGFLNAYEGLAPSDETGAVRVSTSTALVMQAYGAIIIDDATVLAAKLSAAQSEAIRGALATSLRTELARDRTIVTTPASGTLRVRYAIAEVKTSNVALNALTTTVLGPVDYGSLALEVEVTDAVTGERVAAMTWARRAKATNVLGAYSPTGNARALAPDFAKRLAMLISKDMPG